MLDFLIVDRIIKTALNEDMPMGDITTDFVLSEDSVSKATLIAKEDGIIAGIDVFSRVFKLLDDNFKFTGLVNDGDTVKSGDKIAEMRGNTKIMLKGERTALNLLQRMSGIATLTNKFCEKVKGTSAKIVDTRKTTAGIRYLEKYAVRAGGGTNHRFCLSDGVLIKDNHIKAAGGIKKAIDSVKSSIPHTIKIEVETESIAQVNEALENKADIIMLDNMSVKMMKEAVQLINNKAVTEASGNVNLDNVTEIAGTGVNLISVGALTHSVKALDISLKFL